MLIIASNRLLREGITALLNEQPDLDAIAAAPAWSAVQPLMLESKPQLILLDSSLGPQYGMRLLETAKEARPTLRMIVMDMLGAPDEVVGFVQAGCSGPILKDATLDQLTATIRSVAQGIAVLPPALAETIFDHVVRRAAGQHLDGARESVMLTPREREVVALIAEGHSNKEIADRLHIAVHTVKSHVHAILEKLTLHTRLEIAAHAHRKSDPSQQRVSS
ncbi:MAG: response regulator transcription factor [Gemmatimonadota bacterium]|nr:response regulator transcription factor [Gemmatimonadota bacterium]